MVYDHSCPVLVLKKKNNQQRVHHQALFSLVRTIQNLFGEENTPPADILTSPELPF